MTDTAGFKAPDGDIQVHSALVTGVPVPTVLLLASSVYLWGRPSLALQSQGGRPRESGKYGRDPVITASPGVTSLGVLCRDLLLRVL